MKLHRLRGRKTAELLLRKGMVWKGRTMVVRWLPGVPRLKGQPPLPPGLYLGTFASAKLHKSAVKRNRMRRRVREALRVQVKDRDTFPSAQLLISPRIASLEAPSADIHADVRSFLSLLTHGR